jgi:hypothetical protein
MLIACAAWDTLLLSRVIEAVLAETAGTIWLASFGSMERRLSSVFEGWTSMYQLPGTSE